MATRLSPLGGRSSRSDEVLAAIRDALLSGAFAPGEQLREGQIALQLGVSKTPVREALSTLRAGGLVKSSSTRGVVVMEIDRDMVRWLYELRGMLEPEAVRRAVPKVDDRLVAKARQILDEAARHGERRDFSALSRLNRDFHELLYERCENQHLQRVLNDMRDQLQFIAASGWRVSPSWELERTEHRAILDAVADRDPERAAQLTSEHIERASLRLSGEGP